MSRHSGNLILYCPRVSTCSMFSRVFASSATAARAVASALLVVSYGYTSAYDMFPRTPAMGIDLKTLVPYLSSATKIYLPGSPQFTTYTVRWSNLEPPTPNVVVVPGTEADVAKIVSSIYVWYETIVLTLLPQGYIRVRSRYSHPCLQWSSRFPHHPG